MFMMFMMLMNSVEGFLSAFYIFVMLFAIATPCWIFGPSLETRFFPVVTNFVATAVASDTTSTTYDISFTKARDCIVVPGMFTWFVVKDDSYIRVDTENLSQAKGFDGKPVVSYRVPGNQSGIVLKVDNKTVQYDSQTVVFYHTCEPFWLTKSIINIP